MMPNRDKPAGSSTALVALAPAGKPHPRRPMGSDPRFLAQLIALDHDLPASRARRRATPAVALDAYRAAAALAPPDRESLARTA